MRTEGGVVGETKERPATNWRTRRIPAAALGGCILPLDEGIQQSPSAPPSTSDANPLDLLEIFPVGGRDSLQEMFEC